MVGELLTSVLASAFSSAWKRQACFPNVLTHCIQKSVWIRRLWFSFWKRTYLLLWFKKKIFVNGNLTSALSLWMLAHPSFPLIADEQLKSSQAHSFIQCYHLRQKQNNDICRWWHCTAWSAWVKALTGWPNCSKVIPWDYSKGRKLWGNCVSPILFEHTVPGNIPFHSLAREKDMFIRREKTQIKCEWGSVPVILLVVWPLSVIF